jgi:hypothetical protein
MGDQGFCDLFCDKITGNVFLSCHMRNKKVMAYFLTLKFMQK